MVESHAAVANQAKRYKLRYEFLIPDFVVFHLALDVLEQARAVLELTDKGLGRAAITNARAAYESAHDLLILVAEPNQYAEMGSLMRAAELVDTENLIRRGMAADTLLQIERTYSELTPEEIVAADGAEWEKHRPGALKLFQEALARVRKDELWKRHWSGLNARERRKRIANIATDPLGIEEMMDAMYGLQSAHAHPSARFGMRDVAVAEDGTPMVGPREADVPGGSSLLFALFAASRHWCATARLSLETSSASLSNPRMQPTGRNSAAFCSATARLRRAVKRKFVRGPA